MIVVSTISSTLSDGLDPSELLCLRGGGRVTGERLIRLGALGTGPPGTDSGLLTREDELGTLVLLFCCVLEADQVVSMKITKHVNFLCLLFLLNTNLTTKPKETEACRAANVCKNL